MKNFYLVFYFLFQSYACIKYNFTSSKGFGVVGKYILMFITSATYLRNYHKAIIIFFSHIFYSEGLRRNNTFVTPKYLS